MTIKAGDKVHVKAHVLATTLDIYGFDGQIEAVEAAVRRHLDKSDGTQTNFRSEPCPPGRNWVDVNPVGVYEVAEVLEIEGSTREVELHGAQCSVTVDSMTLVRLTLENVTAGWTGLEYVEIAS